MFVCKQDYAKSVHPIFIKFGRNVVNGPRKNPLDYSDVGITVNVPCQCHTRQDCVMVGRRSIVVRMLISAGELSLSCARLLAGWLTTLWLSRPLSVSQHGQLSHPSSGVGVNE